MKQEEIEVGFSTIAEKELSFSAKTLAELLQAALNKNAGLRLKVKGFSMFPFIRDSDIVTVSPILDNSVTYGDVVALRDPSSERLIIHRVVYKQNNGYLVQGDYASCPDGVIPKEEILGLVTRIERNGRRVRLGLGWERRIIAILSRKKIFVLLAFCVRILPASFRNILKSIL